MGPFVDAYDWVAANPRSRMVVSLLDDMDAKKRDEHRARAFALLDGEADGRLVKTRARRTHPAQPAPPDIPNNG
ncbi:hypothetical protein ELQ90_12930 [Labedella phragmitis]|uniref:Uncharacterized protein n=1 Tax=Labedella phragmitis TaxID=2498849 RepID=A0A444PQU6_9MICO|nr:hypothetical protein [Labedella phragmitis]RWZ49653.1 hypothetical protein ELQ90_12930 [Labedella phragmitis]